MSWASAVRKPAGTAVAAAFVVLAGCSGKSEPSAAKVSATGPVDAGADVTQDAAPEAAPAPEPPADPYAAACANAGVPPRDIECTGLYADLASGTIAADVRAYAPAVPLWSDFAEKERWIWLPPGTTIDATDPNEWSFPIGTKVWKQFTRDGIRVETRFFVKVANGAWDHATYAWNADATAATKSRGGDIAWGTDGGLYHIPTSDECDQCHRGRTDRLLGFEQVSLGLPGATGLTLATLADENLLSPAPSRTSLAIGDDGTGLGAQALAWLHINCGVSCHNADPNSTAYGAGMLLKLDPTLLDGRSSADFDPRATTLGIATTTPTWNGWTRIVPGDAAHSLLAQLISNRGTSNPVDNQMPPIATYLVDAVDTQTIVDWIGKMTAEATDAGPSDGGASD